MGQTRHNRIAEALAKRCGGEYNPERGADIVTGREAIEVEIDLGKLGDGKRQLQGYRKLRYLAVPDEHVPAAVEAAEGTQIGVMNERGRIVKPAVRPKRR